MCSVQSCFHNRKQCKNIKLKLKPIQSIFTLLVASIYANLLECKKSVCSRKEFNSHRVGLGHQHYHHSLFWDVTNMAAVTSCENPLLIMRVILFSLFGISQLQECITGLEVDHNLTICLLIQRKNVLKPRRGMQCYLFPEAATRNNIKQQILLSGGGKRDLSMV